MMQIIHHNAVAEYMQIYSVIKMRREIECMLILKL